MAVGVALSAAGAAAQRYGGETEEKKIIEAREMNKDDEEKYVHAEMRELDWTRKLHISQIMVFQDMSLVLLLGLCEIILIFVRLLHFLLQCASRVLMYVMLISFVLLFKRSLHAIAPEEVMGNLRMLLTKLCRAVRVAGWGGMLGRATVAVSAAVGAFLYAHGHSGKIGDFVAVCAAIIPLTSFQCVGKATQSLVDQTLT